MSRRRRDVERGADAQRRFDAWEEREVERRREEAARVIASETPEEQRARARRVYAREAQR